MVPTADANEENSAAATRSPYRRLRANPATWNRFFTTSRGWMITRATLPAPNPHAAFARGETARGVLSRDRGSSARAMSLSSA